VAAGDNMVSSVSGLCFSCFIRLFQIFYLDVSKVDLGVAHVAMATHACFKRMFQVFHLFSYFMLQMFHLDVSKVDRVLHAVVQLLLPVRRHGSRAEA